MMGRRLLHARRPAARHRLRSVHRRRREHARYQPGGCRWRRRCPVAACPGSSGSEVPGVPSWDRQPFVEGARRLSRRRPEPHPRHRSRGLSAVAASRPAWWRRKRRRIAGSQAWGAFTASSAASSFTGARRLESRAVHDPPRARRRRRPLAAARTVGRALLTSEAQRHREPFPPSVIRRPCPPAAGAHPLGSEAVNLRDGLLRSQGRTRQGAAEARARPSRRRGPNPPRGCPAEGLDFWYSSPSPKKNQDV